MHVVAAGALVDPVERENVPLAVGHFDWPRRFDQPDGKRLHAPHLPHSLVALGREMENLQAAAVWERLLLAQCAERGEGARALLLHL